MPCCPFSTINSICSEKSFRQSLIEFGFLSAYHNKAVKLQTLPYIKLVKTATIALEQLAFGDEPSRDI